MTAPVWTMIFMMTVLKMMNHYMVLMGDADFGAMMMLVVIFC